MPLRNPFIRPAQPAQPNPAAVENARLQAELRQMKLSQIANLAQQSALAHMAAGRLFPSERVAYVRLFEAMAMEDLMNPRTDGQPSCVALLEAAYTVRPPHRLDQELISAGGMVWAPKAGADSADIAAAEESARRYAARKNSDGRD